MKKMVATTLISGFLVVGASSMAEQNDKKTTPDISITKSGENTIRAKVNSNIRAGKPSDIADFDIYYTNSHEWVKTTNSVTRIGISEFRAKEIVDVHSIELPKAGTHVIAGQAFATIEAVKVTVEIYSPVSGKIIRVNKALETMPELVLEEPLGKGWLAEIQMDTPGDFSGLLNRDTYQKNNQN